MVQNCPGLLELCGTLGEQAESFGTDLAAQALKHRFMDSSAFKLFSLRWGNGFAAS